MEATSPVTSIELSILAPNQSVHLARCVVVLRALPEKEISQSEIDRMRKDARIKIPAPPEQRTPEYLLEMYAVPKLSTAVYGYRCIVHRASDLEHIRHKNFLVRTLSDSLGVSTATRFAQLAELPNNDVPAFEATFYSKETKAALLDGHRCNFKRLLPWEPVPCCAASIMLGERFKRMSLWQGIRQVPELMSALSTLIIVIGVPIAASLLFLLYAKFIAGTNSNSTGNDLGEWSFGTSTSGDLAIKHLSETLFTFKRVAQPLVKSFCFGDGTRWCVSADEYKVFLSYNGTTTQTFEDSEHIIS